jgi:hypothetical protein
MDLKKFRPSNLPNVGLEELQALTTEDIKELALAHPFMQGELLIRKADNTGIASPATWKSLYSLLKSGHKFKIVDIKNKKAITSAPIVEVINNDFVEPERSLFAEEIQFIHLSDDKPKKKKK